jgi:hypothetical protein
VGQAFFPPDYEPWLWKALAKLNKMRNDIAHNILPRQNLSGRITAWVNSVPSSASDFTDKEFQFEFLLWNVFDAVSELVDRLGAITPQPPRTDRPAFDL